MKKLALLKVSLLVLPALFTIAVATSPTLADSVFPSSKQASLVRDGRVIGGGYSPNAPKRKAKVSYEDFKKLTLEVESHRAGRLVDLDTFLKMSQEPGVIILDTRTPARYASTHVKGAVNLAFTEFTQGNLARVIPSPDTKILIYCNNNFDGDEKNFASKGVFLTKEQMVAVSSDPKTAMKSDSKDINKPVSLALNVPTYINLYGYGYRNVYELDELVSVNDPRIQCEGSVEVKKLKFVWKDGKQQLVPETPTAESK